MLTHTRGRSSSASARHAAGSVTSSSAVGAVQVDADDVVAGAVEPRDERLSEPARRTGHHGDRSAHAGSTFWPLPTTMMPLSLTV